MITVRCTEGRNIARSQLEDAAQLFSEYYGIWSKTSANTRPHAGERAKMSPKFLKKAVFPDNGSGFLYQALDNDGIVRGHVFTASWQWRGRKVTWITQLVVHRDWRRKGIATEMLKAAVRDGAANGLCGILSSHPAALRALMKATGKGVHLLEQRRLVQEGVLEGSTIAYVGNAKVRESMRTAFTSFWVDHEEPEEVARQMQEDGKEWLLGELGDGEEYLLLVELAN